MEPGKEPLCTRLTVTNAQCQQLPAYVSTLAALGALELAHATLGLQIIWTNTHVELAL